MTMKGFWILCYIACFVGSCKAAESLQLKKQLIEFRMCQHFCQQMSGCHVLTYRQRNLTCQISDEYDPVWTSENGINIFNVSQTDSLNVIGNRKCQKGSVFTRRRARLFQCVQYRRRQKNQVPKDSAIKWKVYLKMTSDTYKICQKLYQLCGSGKKKYAKKQLLKLCAKSGHAGRKLCYFLSTVVFKRGCDLSQVNRHKDSILHIASRAGLLHVVKCVLSKGRINLERRNSFGMTAIMKAAFNAQTEMFRLLLNVGSDLSKTDNKGNSLLHIACKGGNLTIVKDILKEGSVSIHSRTKHGWTPIMTAVKLGKEEMFKLLMGNGSNLSEVSDSGSNLLHIASSQRNLNLLKYILNNKIAGVDSEDFTGRTPLMMAALHGQRYAFHFLLEYNANVCMVDYDGNNLLHMACKGGNVEIAKALLKCIKKDALMKRNKEGKTPPEVVNKGRHRELLRFLKQMQKDADDEDNAPRLLCKEMHNN